MEAVGANCRCKHLIKTLTKLGFDVRDGKKQGHKVMTHPGLPGFTTENFTCGHGGNPEIKRIYIKNVLKVLRNYELELNKYLGELS